MKCGQILLTWGGIASMAIFLLVGCSSSNAPYDGDESEKEYSVCTPGNNKCKDLNVLQVCNGAGDGWVDDKTCGSDEFCKTDECVKYEVCKPETLRCKDAEFVEKCSANGEQWILYKRCRGDEQCNDANCVKTQQDGDEETDQEIEQPENDAEEQLPCACPGHPEMALIEMPNGDKYCIDRYEATVFENPDCTGRIYGQAKGDWPEDFPDCVGCGIEPPFTGYRCESECRGGSGNINANYYPCSLSGYYPSFYISYYQAYFGCKRVGKELCVDHVWEQACSNGGATKYPYGNEFTLVCNERMDIYHGQLSLIETGRKEECVTSCIVYDMMGNISEWTYWSGPNFNLMGSNYSFAHSLGDIKCNDKGDNLSVGLASEDFGFRCCLNLSQE